MSSDGLQAGIYDERREIRFIRDLKAEPPARREALMAAMESMLDDDGELRRSA